MADSNVVNLTADTAPTGDDLIYTVNDPAGSPADRKVTLTNLAAAAPFTGAFAPLGTAGRRPLGRLLVDTTSGTLRLGTTTSTTLVALTTGIGGASAGELDVTVTAAGTRIWVEITVALAINTAGAYVQLGVLVDGSPMSNKKVYAAAANATTANNYVFQSWKFPVTVTAGSRVIRPAYAVSANTGTVFWGDDANARQPFLMEIWEEL